MFITLKILKKITNTKILKNCQYHVLLRKPIQNYIYVATKMYTSTWPVPTISHKYICMKNKEIGKNRFRTVTRL